MTHDEKLHFINAAISRLTNKEANVKITDALLDLGIDSLDIVEIQLDYEETFSVDIVDNAVLLTVGDLMALMK